MTSSLFQEIADGRQEPSNPESEGLLYQDAQVAAFRPLRPASRAHVLVVPRVWVKTADDLRADDLDLVLKMKAVGEQLVPPGPNTIFCFHRGGWNSVDHLHLHCINTRQQTFESIVKYPAFNTPWCVQLDAVVEALKPTAETQKIVEP